MSQNEFEHNYNEAKRLVAEYFTSNNASKEPGQMTAEKIALLDQTSQYLPGMVGVMNLAKAEYLYLSNQVEEMLGVSREVFMQDAVPPLLPFFPEDHAMIFIHEVVPRLFKAFTDYAAKGMAGKVHFTYLLKFKTAGGEMRWFKHKWTALELAENGFPVSAAKYIQDVTDMVKGNKAFIKLELAADNGPRELVYHYEFADANTKAVLSDREAEILAMVASGKTNKEIADALFISDQTVHTHRKNMLKKNNMRSTAELVKAAVQDGVID